jgi:3-dehydroquinate dehydratase-1
MPARKTVKTRGQKPQLVAVIASGADLRLAKKMSALPDLFELRLDCVVGVKNLERKAQALSAPLIITARHPAEGGSHNLSGRARRDLLLHFLPLARYVDVELRSAHALGTVLESARHNGVGTIISFHDLDNTPSLGSLRAKARRAARFRPAVFKVATRTDTPAQLGRLLEFASRPRRTMAVSAMGMGRLGATSRLLLVQRGSVLAYTSVGKPKIEGQSSFAQFHRDLDVIETETQESGCA